MAQDPRCQTQMGTFCPGWGCGARAVGQGLPEGSGRARPGPSFHYRLAGQQLALPGLPGSTPWLPGLQDGWFCKAWLLGAALHWPSLSTGERSSQVCTPAAWWPHQGAYYHPRTHSQWPCLIQSEWPRGAGSLLAGLGRVLSLEPRVGSALLKSHSLRVHGRGEVCPQQS